MTAVSCRVTQWILDLLDREEIGSERWIRNLPVTLEHLRNSEQRIDWDVFVTLSERLDSLFENREHLFAAFEEFFADRFSREGENCLAGFNSPRQLYWIAHRWVGPALFPGLVGPIREPSESTFELVLEIPESERTCPLLFPLVRRLLAQATHLLDQAPAQISVRGDARRATFTILLPLSEVDMGKALPHESSRRLSVLTNAAGTILIETNSDGRVLYVSPNVAAVLGHTAEELMGSTDLEFVPAEFIQKISEAAASGRTCNETHRSRASYRLRDGGEGWLDTATHAYCDERGTPLFVTVAREITKQLRIENELRESQEQLAEASNLASDYSYCIFGAADGSMTLKWLSGAYAQITGYQPHEVDFGAWEEMVHPDDLARLRVAYDKRIESDDAVEEYRIITRSGETRWISEYSRLDVEDDGSKYWYISCRDITDQKLAEKAQQLSHARYCAIAESSHDVIAEFDATGGLLYSSPNIVEMLGHTPEEAIEKSGTSWIHPDDRHMVIERLGKMLHTGDPEQASFRVKHKDGSWRWIDLSATAYRTADAATRGVLVARDMTERRQREQERRHLASVVKNSSEFIAIFSLEGQILFLNDAGRTLLGFENDAEAQPRTIFECLTFDDAEDSRYRVFPDALRNGQWVGDYRLQNLKTGQMIDTLANVFLVPGVDSRAQSAMAIVARDISDRGRAERALQESEQRYQTLVENAYDLVAEINRERRFVYVSPNYRDLLGYAPEELLGRCVDELLHVDDQEATAAMGRRIFESDENPSHRLLHQDGSWRWLQSHSRRIETRSGETLTVVTSRDITARMLAEVALHESREQLVQSQKMEAIGRLAGGVAHDFNNLLTAITGNCDLILEGISTDHPLRVEADEIMRAAERAGGLTRQLLAFSRRQALQPKVIDLNALVADIDRLLRRLIGEDIELITALEGELPRIKVDPGQLEQLVMNLAVNARDAMPRGGQLTIETASVEITAETRPGRARLEAGRYVTLRVRDSGIGMDAETISRVFEPFFTTKEPGKGTGLGLSTAYGIVQQSNGHIQVDSQPDSGSTFTIYLPTIDEPPAPSEQRVVHSELCGTETVLLVEDAEPVCKLVRRFLEKHGYTVIDASSGAEALRVSHHHKGAIDLLITDVVLPKMDGRQLASRLESARKDMKVIFMSGFSDEALSDYGVLGTDTVLVQKPFTQATLLQKVRDVLGNPPIPTQSENPKSREEPK